MLALTLLRATKNNNLMIHVRDLTLAVSEGKRVSMKKLWLTEIVNFYDK